MDKRVFWLLVGVGVAGGAVLLSSGALWGGAVALPAPLFRYGERVSVDGRTGSVTSLGYDQGVWRYQVGDLGIFDESQLESLALTTV